MWAARPPAAATPPRRACHACDGTRMRPAAAAPTTPPAARTARVCRKCDGTLTVPCPACSGSGRLPLAGYGQRNTVNLAKVAGTSWTALRPLLGRTHFHATSTRRLPSGASLVRLVATCDPATVVWVSADVLKSRAEWAAGSLERAALAERRAGGAGGGAACRSCGGTGGRLCPLCSAAGEVVEV